MVIFAIFTHFPLDSFFSQRCLIIALRRLYEVQIVGVRMVSVLEVDGALLSVQRRVHWFLHEPVPR